MENKEIKNEVVMIGDTQLSKNDILTFVAKQSGFKGFTNTEMLYILNTCREKGLNPMKGEISFFKARNGMIQGIPKYTTQLDLLWKEMKKDPDFITFNVFIDRNKETEEWVATAKADYIKAVEGTQGIPYSREISLYSGDWKNSNGMVRFMLQKQATLQFIRVYYPHIDLGYEEEELKNFNSGFNEQTKPADHRTVDIQVQPKVMEKEIK